MYRHQAIALLEEERSNVAATGKPQVWPWMVDAVLKAHKQGWTEGQAEMAASSAAVPTEKPAQFGLGFLPETAPPSSSD